MKEKFEELLSLSFEHQMNDLQTGGSSIIALNSDSIRVSPRVLT